MRVTNKQLQDRVDFLEAMNRDLRIDVGILTEQNKFFKEYSPMSVVHTLAITTQHLTDACVNVLQSFPTLKR